MSLFQHSVLNKFLNEANQEKMRAAYKKLVEYFHNPVIQENIRESKEEQFQEGFLRELFVVILGYTIKPNPDYNLSTEFKNEHGARKADGAIFKEGETIGVIELKSTKTKDLEAIRLQAFDYKANQKKCVYVITSNFEKIRFYINNAVDFEEFDLFRLEYGQFQILWLCLAKENLLKGIPLTINEASVLKEENITKKIYVDYSLFKSDLYNNLIQNNLSLDIFTGKDEKEIKLILFKKSQKLLDRFLFIFFGEDRGLLPPNSISEIVKQWEHLKELDEYKPLYERYKKYFGYLNEGWKGKKYEIYAYNGGLFTPDEVLDNIAISDEVLKKHTEILTGYDFESEVDVNILGHIFENSLNEIEEITAQIEGAEVDLKKSKRKKDGVYYTPKYITKYIVENTVGKLCSEKKTGLGIDESEYLKSRKGRTTKKLKELDEKLNVYRKWLLTLTICDPACGSGAFLNQALDFLIREHRYIDELRAKMLDVPIVFTEIENNILENNIYGVDINEESVEIAKLSLWLRTAQKGCKLTTLSNNIKCGNSLIDDPGIAGEKAFNWQNEFPEVFREKKKQAWHVTTATHNSRTSQRMWDLKIDPGEAVWLDKEKEIIVTRAIFEIVKEDKLNILAYNICGDHMHIMLVCEKDELNDIVAKIKGRSSYMLNRGVNPSGQKAAPKYADGTRIPTWTRKFNTSFITSGEKFDNTIEYIQNNRTKHQLPENKELLSLVQKITCTRQHAFRTEYTGGFDVVIGNPPYGILINEKEVSHFKTNFPLTNYKMNLYILFIERMFQIYDSGIIHFIIPKSLLFNTYFENLRRYLLEKSKVHEIFMLAEKVFQDAEVGGSLILKFEINKKDNSKEIIKLISADTYFKFEEKKCVINEIEQEFFLAVPKCEISPIGKGENSILKKLQKHKSIKEFYKLKNGINPGNIKQILIESSKLSENHKPIIWGKEFENYFTDWGGEYINYDPNIGKSLTLDDVKSKEGMNKQTRIDFALRTPDLFECTKLLVRKTGDRFVVAKDENKLYFDTLVHGIYQLSPEHNLDFLMAVLNSKPATYLYRLLHDIKGKVFAKISLDKLAMFPLPKGSKDLKTNLSERSIEIAMCISKQKRISKKFLNFILSQYSIDKISNKLQNWHELEFGDFISELNLAIKKAGRDKLSKMEEMEWMEVFESKKAEAQALKSEINKTDREIDQMVYELYGLTDEEIAIVQNSVN